MRFCILLLFSISLLPVKAQDEGKSYSEQDTLLVVGGRVLDGEKIFLDRKLFYDNDTLYVNKQGLSVDSFVFSAFALGQKVSIKNNGKVLSDDVKFQLTNKESNFKFFYLKDIILRTADGKTCLPSVKTIKITFTN